MVYKSGVKFVTFSHYVVTHLFKHDEFFFTTMDKYERNNFFSKCAANVLHFPLLPLPMISHCYLYDIYIFLKFKSKLFLIVCNLFADETFSRRLYREKLNEKKCTIILHNNSALKRLLWSSYYILHNSGNLQRVKLRLDSITFLSY